MPRLRARGHRRQLLSRRGANDDISFELSSRGTIIGVDNGQPDSHESYQARERRAFNGLALVLIQCTSTPGDIVLKASAPSLAAAQIGIAVL